MVRDDHAPSLRPRDRPMFSRWGAFVYRFRRPVAILAVVLAIASSCPRRAGLERPQRRRLAGSRSPNRRRSPPGSTREFGAGKSSMIALFRSTTPGADARSAEFQGAIATRHRRPRRRPAVTGIVGYAETGDARFISTAGDAAYVVIELDMTDEESVDAVDDIRAAIAAAGRLHLPADRLRADHQGLRRAVREGPPEGRGGVAADRGADPRPRLRLDRRGRDAAARRRPRDPEQPGARSTSSPSRSR